MRAEVTSKHLRTSTELTVIAPIKQGFIEYVDTVTYASRLRMLLNTLFELRKGADERSSGKAQGDDVELEYVGPLERLQTLHFVQWAVFDNDTRLMLNVTFDRSWESYIRDIVDIAGPLLDIILCHTADYDGHSTDLGYEKFAQWVREHQVGNDFFYAAEPSLTSDDHRFHRKLAALPAEVLKAQSPGAPAASIGAALESMLAPLRVTIPTPTSGTLQDLQRIAGALFDLRRYFAGALTPLHVSYLSASARQDLVFYDEVAYLLLCGFEAKHFQTVVHSQGEQLLAAWYRQLPARKRTQQRVPATQGAVIPKSALSDIQRGLLTPFPKTTHGCLALVQWPQRQDGASFLRKLRDQISLESGCDEETLSLALTYRGLRSLDLTEDELRAFPKEFREGMEARSGILGDIEASHPSTWRLPDANWPPPAAGTRGEASAERSDAAADTVALASVDAVLLIQTNLSKNAYDFAWSESHPLVARLRELVEGTNARVLHVQALRREYEDDAMVEHFGFRDDVSQPHVPFEGGQERPVLARDGIAPGEIVLGYPNARGETVRYAVKGMPSAEPKRDLLLNGSFMVLRKLEQDVGAFDTFLRDASRSLGTVSEDELKAQMMGRKPGPAGAALEAITRDPRDKLSIPGMAAQQQLNSFDFSEGGCPFHAHIRRVNPRDELATGDAKAPGSNTPQRKTPRILRRSMTYGPTRKTPEHDEPSYERGLLFMALNAGIADQYEILQRWVSGGNSTGLPSSLADLISGASNAAAFPVRAGGELRWVAAPESPLVQLHWGMYSFVPSLHAVDFLIARAEAKESAAASAKKQELVLRGLGIVGKLQTLPEPLAKVEWKRLLENREALEDTRAIWAAVLASGGALRTPYGVLVAGERNVYEVLRSSDTYSVREYWHRMTDSIGAMHLGMDPSPKAMPASCASSKDREYEAAVQADTYAKLAEPLNRALFAISADKGFADARLVTNLVLKALPRNPDTQLATCDLRDVCGTVLQGVSALAFGMPTMPVPPLPKAASSIADFRQCSAYVFTPNPESWVAEGAREASGAIRAAYQLDEYKAVGQAQVELPADPTVGDPNEALAASLKGAAFGFLAATLGSVVSVLMQWVDSGRLWRLQQALPTLGESAPDDAQRQEDLARLRRELLGAMQQGPVPPVLHRQVIAPAQLGAVSLVPGDRVVASLATVPAENPNDVDVMFGGRYEAPDKPVHACPGRELAIGVMQGLVWTLLEQPDLRRISDLTPLKLTFR